MNLTIDNLNKKMFLIAIWIFDSCLLAVIPVKNLWCKFKTRKMVRNPFNKKDLETYAKM